MILAIVPLPRRLMIGSLIENIRYDAFYAPQVQSNITLACGRNIVVPPAGLFKVVSIWNNVLYEHIFLSYEPINPYNLMGTNHPVEMFPISVKRYGEDGTCTYLFVDSINHLFIQPQFREACMLAGCPSLDSVISIPYFMKACIEPSAFLVCDEWGSMRRDLFTEQLSQKLSPAVHTEACNMFYEIMQYCGNSDGLASYVDDMFTYETGQKWCPEYFTEAYEYGFRKKMKTRGNGSYEMYNVDPITGLCLASGSTITSTRLAAYIADDTSIRNYLIMANTANQFDTELFTQLSTQLTSLTSNSNHLDGLIEALCQISASDVIIVAQNSGQPSEPIISVEYGFMFYLPQTTVKHSANEFDIKTALSKISLDYYHGHFPWTSITITKNWLDEIFLIIENSGTGELFRSYINIPYFNLTGPALINQQSAHMFKKLT